MSLTPSANWKFDLELEDDFCAPSSLIEAMQLATAADRGTLGAEGENGDCIELRFDQHHGMVLYMLPDQTVLRPHFPQRECTGEDVELSFCPCCGVLVGDRDEMISKCMARDEAFQVCESILRGTLPDRVDPISANAILEWRRLQPRGSTADGVSS
jgi:hypothetical protein